MEFFKKHKKLSIIAGVVLVLIFIAMLGSDGGSDGGSDSGDDITQYLMYRKAGNVRDGYYIEVVGLNVECDETGALKVDLNEIWTKYQGKLVIPSEIEGLPVKKVSFSANRQRSIIGGEVDTLNQVQVRFVTNGDDFIYYLNNFDDFLKNIKDLTIPNGVVNINTYDISKTLDKITIPVDFDDDSYIGKIKEVVYTTSDETKVYDKLIKPVGTKSNIFPNNVKKIDLSDMLSNDGDIEPFSRYKGCKITCAPDAEFFYRIGFMERFKLNKESIEQKYKHRTFKLDDIYVNGKTLTEYIK